MSVGDIYTPQPCAEVYRTFHHTYGEAQLAECEASVLIRRVLHFDESNERTFHLVVARSKSGVNHPFRRSSGKHEDPLYHCWYRPEEFTVAATDGVTIHRYDVMSVKGLYRARLNGVDRQYNPANEQLHVSLHDRNGHQGEGIFTVAGGEGNFRLPTLPLGWILGQSDSNWHIESSCNTTDQLAS